jgi:predicted choloylglycine hydrolase
MKQLIFRGNYKEIGRQLGRLYKTNGKLFSGITINEKLFKKQLSIYQKYYPDFIDELKGVAQGGGFDEKKTLYQFLAGSLTWTLTNKIHPRFSECSIFGVKNKNGLLVGRNYDWDPITEKIFKVYKVEPQNKYAYVAVSDMWIGGPEDLDPKNHYYLPIDAINEKGLYIGLTAARNYNWSYGLPSVHLIKLIAENCRNVNEAINIFKKVPLNCAKNFLIGDQAGKMVAIEHLAGTKFKIVYPQDNILIQTNHFTHPDLIKEDRVKKTSTSFLRYYEISREINLRGVDKFKQSDIIKILGAHGSYVLQDSPRIKTVWSLSLNLKNADYRLYCNLFGRHKSLKLKI